MPQEQAVLDFFALTENLPLALSVAEQTDRIREQINTKFWHEFSAKVAEHMRINNLIWQVTVTEDRNISDSIVGLNCILPNNQPLYLRPILEQQNLGKGLQIYFGLMWSNTATPEHLSLAAISKLRDQINHAGYKHNENFIAWQWTNFYPRSKSFLLRYTQEPEQLFEEILSTLSKLIINHRDSIDLANAALNMTPRSMKISLDQLRSQRQT